MSEHRRGWCRTEWDVWRPEEKKGEKTDGIQREHRGRRGHRTQGDIGVKAGRTVYPRSGGAMARMNKRGKSEGE